MYKAWNALLSAFIYSNGAQLSALCYVRVCGGKRECQGFSKTDSFLNLLTNNSIAVQCRLFATCSSVKRTVVTVKGNSKVGKMSRGQNFCPSFRTLFFFHN